MSENVSSKKVCVVIGASQAGVTFAFALRSGGWDGEILLFDADPMLPYYRPPLSKAVLTGDEDIEDYILKPLSLYERENIQLRLGRKVTAINRSKKSIALDNGTVQLYDKLVVASGARPIIPNIANISSTNNVFTLRSAEDVRNISTALNDSEKKRVVIIGGGYIGLETAASLKKLGASVVILEREERVLARVTAPQMSEFFLELHAKNDVEVHTNKNVIAFESSNDGEKVKCADGSQYKADLIVVGVGVHVNKELAEDAGLVIENGIKVDEAARTNDKDIYAIGDCTFHYNPHYGRYIRLESIQNANDQAKVAATSINGGDVVYNSLPWFWSDQYGLKLQMVGLSEGYDDIRVRSEDEDHSRFSVWYFSGDNLLAVDAVNNTKAYVVGTKFIKAGTVVDKAKLVDIDIPFKPANLIKA